VAQTVLDDNSNFCDQYSKIINFINKDSCAKKKFPVRKFKIHIDSTVGYGIGCPFMNNFYLSETLHLNLTNLSINDSLLRIEWEKLNQEEYRNSNLKVASSCLKQANRKKKNNNINLRFARKNENVVFVNASRIYKHDRDTNGIFYLFFFDEKNNIKRVYRDNWIE
jgi:hypothetical protein